MTRILVTASAEFEIEDLGLLVSAADAEVRDGREDPTSPVAEDYRDAMQDQPGLAVQVLVARALRSLPGIHLLAAEVDHRDAGPS